VYKWATPREKLQPAAGYIGVLRVLLHPKGDIWQVKWTSQELALQKAGWLGALSVLREQLPVICKGGKIGMLSLTLG
jgi:hypothetical protein